MLVWLCRRGDGVSIALGVLCTVARVLVEVQMSASGTLLGGALAEHGLEKLLS